MQNLFQQGLKYSESNTFENLCNYIPQGPLKEVIYRGAAYILS